jgi:hypothetical protein
LDLGVRLRFAVAAQLLESLQGYDGALLGGHLLLHGHQIALVSL